MIFLFAAICVSLTITFTLKVAHIKKWDTVNITMVNYVVGLVVTIIMTVSQHTISGFLELPHLQFSTLNSQKTIAGTMFLSLILGFVTGTIYVINITLTSANVKNNGAGITTLFSRSSFLVSIILSMLVFSEKLSIVQAMGILLTISALAIAGGIGKKTKIVEPLKLVGSIFCLGLLDFNNKLFQMFGINKYKINFTLVAFLSATIFYFIIYVHTKSKTGGFFKFRWQEVVAGICMGVPNVFGNILQILALERISASIVFPTYAAGNLLMSIMISVLVFKEKFGKRQIIAVVLTALSIVLVNLAF